MHCGGLSSVSIVKNSADILRKLTLKTGFDHIKRVSYECRGYTSIKAGDCLNQRWGEARMVIVHRFKGCACYITSDEK
jgi:hypothetical protein